MSCGEHIDHKSEHIREVFAYYGLAMYRAQCLERQLAMMLASQYGTDPVSISIARFDTIMEELFSETLGQLVSKIVSIGALGEDDTERLKTALEQRNRLAHRYFWERATEFLSVSGREVMISELQDAVELFVTLDQSLTNRMFEWGETYGITQQSVDKEIGRLIGVCED